MLRQVASQCTAMEPQAPCKCEDAAILELAGILFVCLVSDRMPGSLLGAVHTASMWVGAHPGGQP